MRRVGLAALPLVILGAQALLHANQDVDTDAVFRAVSDIVLVPASVTDDRGRFVKGLTRDDFLLKEDNTSRPIAQFTAERVPVSVGIVLDASGSMFGVRFAQARFALAHFVSLLERDDEFFLQTFNKEIRLVLPWTQNRTALGPALDTVRPDGVTALFRAVLSAYSVLKQGTHVRKALVVLSDGNDNETSGRLWTGTAVQSRMASGERDTLRRLQRAVQEAQRSNTVLYALGIDAPDREAHEEPLDARKLQLLTDSTGGYTEVVSSPAGIPAAMARIAEDLRSQYLIGFQSEKTDGKTHKIKLTTRNDKYQVRARSVFLAAR